MKRKNLILSIFALLLIACAVINPAVAYFTDNTNASGAIPLQFQYKTEIHEDFEDWLKTVQIENTRYPIPGNTEIEGTVHVSENGREIDSTVYWRSTSKYTGPKKMDGPTTAGFETMDSLPKTKLSAKAAPAKGGTLVTVRNDGKGIAFMVKLLARDAKGRNLKPTFYSDNWFSLMPGETKQVLVEPPTGAASWTAEAWNAPRVTGSLRN